MATMPKGNDWDSVGTNWWAFNNLKSVHDECTDWEGESGVNSDDKVIVFCRLSDLVLCVGN